MLYKSYKKPNCGKNLLHNLYGQFSGFHSFIFSLNTSKVLLFVMQSGTISQILFPNKVKVSVPLYTVLALVLLNSAFFS